MSGYHADQDPNASVLRVEREGILYYLTLVEAYLYETKDCRVQCSAWWTADTHRWHGWVRLDSNESAMFHYTYPQCDCAEAVINELLDQFNVWSRVRQLGLNYETIAY